MKRLVCLFLLATSVQGADPIVRQGAVCPPGSPPISYSLATKGGNGRSF